MVYVFARVVIMELQTQQVLLHAMLANQAVHLAQLGQIVLLALIQTLKLLQIAVHAKVLTMEHQVQQRLLHAIPVHLRALLALHQVIV